MNMLEQVKIQLQVERIADIKYQSFCLKIHPISFWAWYFNEPEMEDWSENMQIEVWK